MKRELGIGRCGLACALCSENGHCGGCQTDDCPDSASCENRKCSMEKGVGHCYECGEACTKGMLSKIKPFAFTEFIRRYGEAALLDCLERNEARGVVYHREGITGDYDDFDDAEALIRFIQTGSRAYQDINAATIDRWVREGWEWGRPISHEIYQSALSGEWELFLTPNKPVPRAWLGDLRGKRVLGLASGGGQQMPILTALGARCTVLDYSPLQIESERMVAAREGYDIEIIRGDMTRPLPFADGTFDLIFHPVSNCYVEAVRPIWRECFRVLKPGGELLAGTDHYVNYIVDAEERQIVNHLPFNPLRDPEQMRQLEQAEAGVQFSHSLEEQIGGQLEAGFTLLELYEDTNHEGRLRELNIPTFLAMRSRKPVN